MKKPPTQQQLADELGINQSQVSRYARRGMPLDVRGAKAWMRQNIRLTMNSPQSRRLASVQAEAVDADRALDGVELLGIAAEQLVRAGQPLDALTPLLQDALRAVPPEHRDRIVLRGTDGEWLQLYGRTARCASYDTDVPFPIVVWHALIEPTLRIGKAEQEKLGPAQPLTDEEAEVAAAFWYSIAAGEFKVLSP